MIKNRFIKGRNLCKGIRLAARHWQESNLDPVEKYANLENDIMNALSHYLGHHDKCGKYFCKKTTNPEAQEIITVLKDSGMWYEVMDLLQSYFGNNAKSLIAGYCTNKAEGFNSLIAKSLGKKIFYHISQPIGLIKLRLFGKISNRKV